MTKLQYTWIVILFLVLVCACGGPAEKRALEDTPETDSVYYQDQPLYDSSDTALLKVLYDTVLLRKKGSPAGLYQIYNQPTTRLEPYPNDTTLAFVHERFYYTENGSKKQLVVLALEQTETCKRIYRDFHFAMLSQKDHGWVLRSVWYEQYLNDEFSSFTLNENDNKSILMEARAKDKRILGAYHLHNDRMARKENGLLRRIKGRRQETYIFP